MSSSTNPSGVGPEVVTRVVPRSAQWFVAVFLTVFMFCGYFGMEAWPLTGWRLFSQLRTDRQTSWKATAVDLSGTELPIPFGRLSYAYRGFPQVLKEFSRLPRSEQVAVCRAWAAAASGPGRGLPAVRIYSTEWRLSRRSGMRAAPPTTTLRFECRDNSVRRLRA
ncbi:MAG: hypothetical protein ACR2FO_09200 [Actinomycetota bacterium]